MPLTFDFRIRAAPVPDDERGADGVGDGGDPPGHRIRQPERLDDLRQPEADAVIARHHAEIDQRQRPDARIAHGLPDRQVMRSLALPAFGDETGAEPGALVRREPGCVVRQVGQIEISHNLQTEPPAPPR